MTDSISGSSTHENASYIKKLEYEKLISEAKFAELKDEIAKVNKNYYEMYRSREEWRQYATQFKETCAHHLEELKQREVIETEFVSNVRRLVNVL